MENKYVYIYLLSALIGTGLFGYSLSKIFSSFEKKENLSDFSKGFFFEEYFFWENAIRQNTVKSYDNYRKRYPQGKYLSLIEPNREKAYWKETLTKSTYNSYKSYLKAYPKGKFVTIANENAHNSLWSETQNENTSKSYKRYLSVYPNGNFSDLALNMVEKQLWIESNRINTISSYRAYLKEFPNGDNKLDAESRIEDLTWQDLQLNQNWRGLEFYLSTYPNGKFSKQAKYKLQDLYWETIKKNRKSFETVKYHAQKFKNNSIYRRQIVGNWAVHKGRLIKEENLIFHKNGYLKFEGFLKASADGIWRIKGNEVLIAYKMRNGVEVGAILKIVNFRNNELTLQGAKKVETFERI